MPISLSPRPATGFDFLQQGVAMFQQQQAVHEERRQQQAIHDFRRAQLAQAATEAARDRAAAANRLQDQQQFQVEQRQQEQQFQVETLLPAQEAMHVRQFDREAGIELAHDLVKIQTEQNIRTQPTDISEFAGALGFGEGFSDVPANLAPTGLQALGTLAAQRSRNAASRTTAFQGVSDADLEGLITDLSARAVDPVTQMPEPLSRTAEETIIAAKIEAAKRGLSFGRTTAGVQEEPPLTGSFREQAAQASEQQARLEAQQTRLRAEIVKQEAPSGTPQEMALAIFAANRVIDSGVLQGEELEAAIARRDALMIAVQEARQTPGEQRARARRSTGLLAPGVRQ